MLHEKTRSVNVGLISLKTYKNKCSTLIINLPLRVPYRVFRSHIPILNYVGLLPTESSTILLAADNRTISLQRCPALRAAPAPDIYSVQLANNRESNRGLHIAQRWALLRHATRQHLLILEVVKVNDARDSRNFSDCGPRI